LLNPQEISGRRYIIAIDPGQQGALASYNSTASPLERFKVEKLCEDPLDRVSQIKSHAEAADLLKVARIALVEEVGGFAGRAHPGSRMFTFGRGLGQLEGVLLTLAYSVCRVRPSSWQKDLSLLTRKGESRPDHKRRLRARAGELFPILAPTLQTADAILILYAFLQKQA
jgi:hypothetical protein